MRRVEREPAMRAHHATRRVVVNVCNDVGLWTRGPMGALESLLGATARTEFRRWYHQSPCGRLILGEVQYVDVDPTTVVANVVAARGVRTFGEARPIRHEALQRGLDCIMAEHAEVHILCDACTAIGGSWESLEALLEASLQRHPACVVTAYEGVDRAPPARQSGHCID